MMNLMVQIEILTLRKKPTNEATTTTNQTHANRVELLSGIWDLYIFSSFFLDSVLTVCGFVCNGCVKIKSWNFFLLFYFLMRFSWNIQFFYCFSSPRIKKNELLKACYYRNFTPLIVTQNIIFTNMY